MRVSYFPDDRDRHQLLRVRALELHRSGQLQEAAAGYEKVLESWPDDAGVHGNLAGIRLTQGKRLEAIRHIYRACELGNWSDPVVGRNFAHIIRSVLEHLDRGRLAAQWRNYLDRNSATKGLPLTVSVLAPDTTPDLARQLGELAHQQLLPAEVLVGTHAGPIPAGLPFPVRKATLPAANSRYACINVLAQQAIGHWLLVLRAGDVLAPDHLSSLAEAMTALKGWGYCCNSAEIEPFVTAGYEVLRGDAITAGEAGLLVARTLHERIGGYDPDSPDPDVTYCLRLLWEAEPARVAIAKSCLAVVREIRPGQLKTVVASYLSKAMGEAASPNPFLPCAHNWGLSFYKFAMDQGWMLSLDAIRRMVSDMTSYLMAAESRLIQSKPGVNLVGPVLGEFGLGENMRAFARAANAGGIPTCIIDVEFGSARQGDAALLDRVGEKAVHPCSVFFFNPDLAHFYHQSLDNLVFGRPWAGFPHYKIGYWAWELDRFPPEWRYALDQVDEIWTLSGFVAKAIATVTDKPVIKIPTPIALTVQGGFDRAFFGLPADCFLFLYSFSFASYPARKNPEAAIKAFKRAFPNPRTRVGLVLKSTHGEGWPEALGSLRTCIGDDPRIILIDQFMNRDEVSGLQHACDAYVSLHRSEGLGLGMAEAMFLGKPVIATGYSGNLEFMTEDNSGLVRYTMAPVRSGEYYLCDAPGYFWAEPDIGHAAELMTRVFEDRAYRERIGARGRLDILSKHNHAMAAAAMRSRLVEIGVL